MLILSSKYFELVLTRDTDDYAFNLVINFIHKNLYDLSWSKLFYLNYICKKKRLDKKKHAISVGDGANDLGMLKNSGLGIGYRPHHIIEKAVDNHIRFTDLTTILFYLGFTEKEFSK